MDVSPYLKQTISEKPIEFFFSTLLGTLCVTPYNLIRGFKVKTLLKMGNSQVTKAFNSLVGTSEAIRLLSIKKYVNYRSYHAKNKKINHPLLVLRKKSSTKPKGKSKS